MQTPSEIKSAEYKRRFALGAQTAKWAVTMTKVRIRQAVAKTPFPRWHFITFEGPTGVEPRGIVDMIAVRKDHHSTPQDGLNRGDAFQIILIQVKGGSAARPTREDAKRLQLVARLYHADHVLLAAWKKGNEAQFSLLDPQSATGESNWSEVKDLKEIFCNPKGSQAPDESSNSMNEPLDGIEDVEGTMSQVFVGGVRKPNPRA